MQVVLFATNQAQEWHAAVLQAGHDVHSIPIGSTFHSMGEVCLVVPANHAEVQAMRFWLSTLTAPVCLVTTAISLAQALAQRNPLLRVICHPNRAIVALDDMLQMTREMHTGSVSFGPLELQRVVGEGGTHAR